MLFHRQVSRGTLSGAPESVDTLRSPRLQYERPRGLRPHAEDDQPAGWQDEPPELGERQAEGSHRQRLGGRTVVLVVARTKDLHGSDARRASGLAEEGPALLTRFEEGRLDILAQQREHQPRRAVAGSHVDERPRGDEWKRRQDAADQQAHALERRPRAREVDPRTPGRERVEVKGQSGDGRLGEAKRPERREMWTSGRRFLPCPPGAAPALRRGACPPGVGPALRRGACPREVLPFAGGAACGLGLRAPRGHGHAAVPAFADAIGRNARRLLERQVDDAALVGIQAAETCGARPTCAPPPPGVAPPRPAPGRAARGTPRSGRVGREGSSAGL